MSEALYARMAAAAPPDPCAARLCLLTGQARWDASPLTPVQRQFLEAVASPPFVPLLRGFPFDGQDVEAAPPALPLAALRNARQAATAGAARFRTAAAAVLQGLIEATSERLAIVTGSCGLEILGCAWPALSLPPGREVRVLAFGPTGRPLAGAVVAQGRRDGWSRLLYRGEADHSLECGHMGYWADADARVLARAWLGGG